MRRYKAKIFLTLALVGLFTLMLVTTALCADINIYFETATGIEDSFSQATVEEGGMVTLPQGKAPEGYSYVWVTTDGKSYAGGSKVAFYEETTLKAIYAYDIETADDFYAFCNKFDDSAYASLEPNDINLLYHHDRYINVRLLNDITLSKAVSLTSSIGSNLNIILNGYKLTIDKNLDMAIGGECFATNFYGAGTVYYEGTGAIVRTDSTSRAGAEETKLFVGASTYVYAPNAALAKDTKGDVKVNYPVVQIYGTVNCKNILAVTNSTNRNPSINIYDRAFVTLNGAIAVGDGNQFTITISGGTFVTTNTSQASFANENYKYKITGGSFSFKYTDGTSTEANALKNNATGTVLSHITSDGVRYYTVFPPNTCASSSKHKYSVLETNAASCMHAKETIFKCSECKYEVCISSGAPAGHTIDDSQNSIVLPTPTTKGELVRRCNACGCAQYTFSYYDPREDVVDVVVDLGNGSTRIVTAKASEIFVIDDNYKITGIRNGKDYTADKVSKIYVLAGIKGIEFSSDYASLKTIVLRAGLDIDIISLSKLTALETIEIEKVNRAKFHANCAPTSLKTVKTTQEGAKVIFGENSFAGATSLTSLVFTKNSEYSFDTQSFKGAGIKKLELKKGISYSFVGESAFTGSKLEYLFVDEGITSFEKKQFDSISTLKQVILMNVTKLADGEFANMGANAVVYHHASSLTMGNKTFAGSNGVTLYTVASITTGFDYNSSTQTFGTQFTIMKNIKHAYNVVQKDPTCTETGYTLYVVKDCPCNKNEGKEVAVYKNTYTTAQVYETLQHSDKTYPKKDHIPSESAVIKYLDGYTKEGSYVKVCKMCSGALTDSADTCAPLVISLGYSISEENDGTGSMVVKYIFNTGVLKEYKQTISGNFEYGVVFAARANGSIDENETPLDESGAVKNGAIKLDGYSISNGYASFQMKMGGITESHYKINFIMSAYIIENSEITYIQENEVVNNPSGVTYKELKEIFEYAK